MQDRDESIPGLAGATRHELAAMRERLRRFIYGRRYAYAQTFGGVHAEAVLADLAQFCRANESTFHPDQRVAAVLEGRREVWLRIQQHLQLSPEEVFDLATGQPPTSHPTSTESDFDG